MSEALAVCDGSNTGGGIGAAGAGGAVAILGGGVGCPPFDRALSAGAGATTGEACNGALSCSAQAFLNSSSSKMTWARAADSLISLAMAPNDTANVDTIDVHPFSGHGAGSSMRPFAALLRDSNSM